MKTRLACFVAAVFSLQTVAAQYRTALPGYRYEFPRDHFNHPEFQTEWWYYTGNLKSNDGRRFGFELTLFRQAVSRDLAKTAAWDVKDVYLAHLALSDLKVASFITPNEQTDPDPELRVLMKPAGASGMATGRLFGKRARNSCRQSTSDFNCTFPCVRRNRPSSMGRTA